MTVPTLAELRPFAILAKIWSLIDQPSQTMRHRQPAADDDLRR